MKQLYARASEAERILGLIKTKKSRFWERVREQRALELFHRASRGVPAYKDFLKKNRIQSSKIKTFKDFQLVPPVSKKNYLREYPFNSLLWNGNLKKDLVFTATSGSTGEPFYFPRSDHLDFEYSIIAESFLKNNQQTVKGPCLLIIGFGMGIWIGGLITYQAYELAARRRGYPLSILTPGINKKEIYNALRRLAPQFAQTIIIGYAPFIKDILDGAEEEGINLKKINLRLGFAAEAFTENFRDYLADHSGLQNIYLDTMNIYGSADIGAMAYETPVAILARRLAMKDRTRRVFRNVFGGISKTPTLAQYNPLFITFEAPEGNILLTGDNSIPLVRYSIGDHGGVSSYENLQAKFNEGRISLHEEARKNKIAPYISELPFVFVYERSDFATTLYGLQIYPEHIREALIKTPVSNFLTGKFSMFTKFTSKNNQYLEINLEMRKGIRKIDKKTSQMILKSITLSLENLNSEFKELYKYLGKKALPHLVFWPAEHPKYFRPGVKQRWVENRVNS